MEAFNYTFVVNRGRIFGINYRLLAGNSAAYFATSVAVFNRPRTDFNRCGQCQDDVLVGDAHNFYKKWSGLHLNELTKAQYSGIIEDIEALKIRYPFYIQKKDGNISFSEEVEIEREWRNTREVKA